MQLILTFSQVIMSTKDAIFADAGEKSSEPMGADDFLPVFIFVFINSAFLTPYSTLEFLRHLSSSHSVSGEAKYYLRSYEIAVEVVLTDPEFSEEAAAIG